MEAIVDVEALIHKYKEGSTKSYDQFVRQLASPAVTDEVLFHGLQTLKDSVTLLNKEHEVLVGIVLKLDWASRGEKIVEVYQSLIINLISVHTDYLKACLRMIIKKFLPVLPKNPTKDALGVMIDEETLQKNDHVFGNLHTLLNTITKIVPMAPTLIMPLLLDMFPYYTKDVYLQECYIRNLFQITYNVPTLRQPILELIVDKMMMLDVRSPRAKLLEMRPTDTDVSLESGIFNMDDESVGCKEADVLDVLMAHLFQYIHNICYTNGTLQWEATKRIYRELLFVFEKIILPTYACCHIQFIMFYLASIKPELCDGFLDFLWKLVQNPNIQAVYRQSAVSYMSSLMARGKFVTIGTAKKTIELMMKWVHTYTQTCQDSVMADVTHHGPFYSVCQAVFYVFSFRQKEIFDTKKGLKWAEGLQFQHLIQSRLNPLKVCFPIIVKTFASITRQHQLAFCDHIIQQNNRSFLPVVSNGTQKILESYFPFDPYLLKRSSNFVLPFYREYDQTVDVDENSDSSDDDDEMFTEASTSKAAPIAMMSGSLVDKAALDFMSYSTSPGFKH